MADRPLLERIARHLSEGDADRWGDRLADAASILALMKDADPAMREAGDMATWSAMVDAALAQRWSLVLVVNEVDNGGFPEFLADALLRTETRARTESYAVATGKRPWMHPSEVRDRENLAPDDTFDSLPLPGAPLVEVTQQ